jgi:hypothetical protein
VAKEAGKGLFGIAIPAKGPPGVQVAELDPAKAELSHMLDPIEITEEPPPTPIAKGPVTITGTSSVTSHGHATGPTATTAVSAPAIAQAPTDPGALGITTNVWGDAVPTAVTGPATPGPVNAVPGFPSEIGVTPTQSMPGIGVTSTPQQLSTGTYGGLTFGTSVFGSETDTASQLGTPNVPQSHINAGFGTLGATNAPVSGINRGGGAVGIPTSRGEAMENEAIQAVKGIAPKGMPFGYATPIGPQSSVSDSVGKALSALFGISTAEAAQAAAPNPLGPGLGNNPYGGHTQVPSEQTGLTVGSQQHAVGSQGGGLGGGTGGVGAGQSAISGPNVIGIASPLQVPPSALVGYPQPAPPIPTIPITMDPNIVAPPTRTSRGTSKGDIAAPPPPITVKTVPVTPIEPAPIAPPKEVVPLPKERPEEAKPPPKEVVPLPKERPEEAKPPPVVVERAPPVIKDTPLTKEVIKDIERQIERHPIPLRDPDLENMQPPPSPLVATTTPGTLGTGITGFTPGGNINDWINRSRRIIQTAVTTAPRWKWLRLFLRCRSILSVLALRRCNSGGRNRLLDP